MSGTTPHRSRTDPAAIGHLFQDAVSLQQQGRLEEAARCYEAILAADAGHFDALHRLGVLRGRQGRLAEAAQLLRRAARRNPGSAPALNNLGMTLNLLKRPEAALAPLERAITLTPEYAIAHNNLGTALEALGRGPEARGCFERALQLKPDYPEALNNLGLTLLQNGRLEVARGHLEQAIRLEPDNPTYYASLFQCGPVTASDPHLPRLEGLARNAPALDEERRVQLHFALAKAYGDIGQPARAFDELLAGNALKRRRITYDEAQTLGRIERIRAVFSRELLQAKPGLGCASELPIFIVGMMRSGSTLIEQILASHPRVRATGEVPCLNEAWAAAHRRFGLATPFPDAVGALEGPQQRDLGEEYLRRLTARGGAATACRITDKMPGNFTAAGLIHLALPRARIIHTVRDPIDTCLSCFATLFREDQPFSYDLGELGRYYRAYARLMQHWRAVLPEGTILEVRYEQLIEDFEPQVRRILGYCGLEWHDACRDFHRTERAVRTASVVQVRQPLHRSSVGRWRPGPQLLAPLLEGLGQENR